MMEKAHFPNDCRTFMFALYVVLPAIVVSYDFYLILFNFDNENLSLDIPLITLLIFLGLFGFHRDGTKYSLVLSEKYIWIFSKKFRIEDVRYVLFFMPQGAVFKPKKGGKRYASITFCIKKGRKIKKIMVDGICVPDHYDIIDFLQKHRIRYGVNE